MSITDELRRFLGSVKSSEKLSQDLRDAISVDTGLEEPLVKALEAEKRVLIAGSAGGGKTHLLHYLSKLEGGKLPRLIHWPKETEPKDEPYIRVVPDATKVVPKKKMAGVFEGYPPNCKGVVVAMNEGPLLDLARGDQDSVFSGCVSLLHRGQAGIETDQEPDLPTVIDVGGFDPVDAGVIAELLDRAVLNDLIAEQNCSCDDPRICPRRVAWQLLGQEEVRRRINDVLRLVTVRGRPILFREIWDFIQDLVMNGRCQDSPPTSPWFWRVFYGDSALSARLRAVGDPTLVVFPRLEAHLWYRNLSSESIELLPNTALLPPVSPTGVTEEEYRWLKSQVFFLVRESSVLEIIRDQVDLQLVRALEQNRTEELISVLNFYTTYGTQTPISQQELFLWTDMGVERHTIRAKGQVCLGRVSTSEFKLAKSQALINHPDTAQRVAGYRWYLRHDPSGVSFALTPETLHLLRGGRSYRSADRPHTDLEWHISRFYRQLAAHTRNPGNLGVLSVDFEEMTGDARWYHLSPEVRRLEPAAGGPEWG